MRTPPHASLYARAALLLCMLVAVTACASAGGKGDALQRVQYAYSAAIRWGDFETAWNMVEPAYREKHPMTDVQLERYRQIQVSHYRDISAQAGEGTAVREIDIGVINRHTMAERSLRYQEAWRYDAESRAWVLTSGLPDFWRGE
ncbi:MULTISPECIES: hypothetical protein [unclassified Luteimonas]|uniref:hypothetical protein n=1 Tax=unclassified Luteimonas TaxID=2629088 RepID=UPI001603D821|nr:MULTISPECIES: hypothetical protein [unclassified Luteimonas]MBB1473169.1 hypothetical protein [Luteimonas sp. MC1782]MBB6598127.1 hypothetical protein [Luteimonas sp. MC1825]QOC88361.1 hypothetical protein IDM46_00850 [Luteimonas sp. MC1825]